MKLHESLTKALKEQSDVVPGNVYPAKGGSKSPGTEYWLVIAVSNSGAHCIGFDVNGYPCSTSNYLKGAMRERPLLGKVDLTSISLEPITTRD